jgi:hypothetical protein
MNPPLRMVDVGIGGLKFCAMEFTFAAIVASMEL